MDYKSKTANDKEISIYYFSATGNSLKLSQDIAAAFGGAGLFRMTPSAGITASDSRIVGFIFPVYMGGLPALSAGSWKVIRSGKACTISP